MIILLSVHTKMLYPVNPCSFVMKHGNELRQIHLISGAPHCVNPSLIKLLGVCLYMGRIFLLGKFLCICLEILGPLLYTWE